MTKRTSLNLNELEPAACVSYRLRRAARAAAKSYDSALKPSGLRNTQFTLLASLSKLGESNIGDLSDHLGLDGTTLTRNLEVMVRRGLIDNIAVEDARVRNVRISDLGKKTYKQALPLWRKAQRHALKALEPNRWARIKGELDKIEGALTG